MKVKLKCKVCENVFDTNIDSNIIAEDVYFICKKCDKKIKLKKMLEKAR